MRRVAALALALALTGCAGVAQRPAPAIVGVADWGGSAAPVAEPAQRITHITLHHQGELWRDGADVPAYLQRLQQWSRNTRRWADIPYHYVIAPDGRIYAARPLAVPGDTNTEYDPRGHALLMLLGNFEVQQPTAAQLDAAVALTAWLARQHQLGVAAIATHREFSTQTLCPGRHLYAHLASGEFQAAVARHLK